MKKNSKKLRTLVALAIVAVVAVGFVTNVGIGTMSAPGIWDISIYARWAPWERCSPPR